MGFSGAKIAPSPPYTPPGTIEARKGFGSTIRNSRLAALPLATLLPLSSAWSLRVFAPPCADACAVFRVFAPLSPSAARCSGAADALWACPRASSRFAAFDCALRFASCARHSSPSGLRRSQAHSRCSLLHWAHRRLLHPQFAMVVLLRPTACSTPASQFSMVASLRSQSSLEMLPASLGSSAAIAATGCAASFALIGLTTACFAHCARPSCAPLAAPPLSPSLDFRFACFRHWRRRSSVPLALSLGFLTV